MMQLSIAVFVILTLLRFDLVNGLQCYKCGCFIGASGTTCTEGDGLNCVIQHVEDSYCTIYRTAGEVEFGHSLNSNLMFLQSLHYVRVTELYTYLTNTNSWSTPQITAVTYGCDWNLCNSPRILSLLPTSLVYTVNTGLMNSLLIPAQGEQFTNCLSCSQCTNSTAAAANCPSVTCSGTCFIDDHIDDPQFNTGSCAFVFESVCSTERFNTSVEISGNYYIDSKISDVTEIDVYCRKNNCNNIQAVEEIRRNTDFTAEINNQLFFRPQGGNTTSPGSNQLPCYTCNCRQDVGSSDCSVLNCNIEYFNGSYCEIVRDFETTQGIEEIVLGHVTRDNVRYSHSISVKEELMLYRNLTYTPPALSFIAYICDWPLCNDPRVVDKLLTSFQFNVNPDEVASFIQGPIGNKNCYDCSKCSNRSTVIQECSRVNCPSNGHCFIEQERDDPQYDSCEYAFTASCQQGVTESSVIISATYDIDTDKLDIDTVDVYCSRSDCNQPSTIDELTKRISEDIQLDPLYFIRPVTETTTTTTTTRSTMPGESTTPTTAPSGGTTAPSTTTAPGGTTTTTAQGVIASFSLSVIVFHLFFTLLHNFALRSTSAE